MIINEDGIADLMSLNDADDRSEVDQDYQDENKLIEIRFLVHFAAERKQYLLGRGDGTFDDFSTA